MNPKELTKKILGIHSPSKRCYYDIRELAKSYANNGCIGQSRIVSEGILDVLMHHVRHYFEIYDKYFNGCVGIYRTIIDNKLNYIVYIHNGIDEDDSYLIKLCVKYVDGDLNIERLNTSVYEAFKYLLGNYTDYKKFKFDIEILYNNKMATEDGYCKLYIEKIDIPRDTFNVIYNGVIE